MKKQAIHRANRQGTPGEVYGVKPDKSLGYLEAAPVPLTSTAQSKVVSQIAANTTTDITIALPGAVVGAGACVAFHDGAALAAGLVWTAFCVTADVVTVRIANVTTGALTPATRNWTAIFFPSN